MTGEPRYILLRFEGGLEKELGGPLAVPARASDNKPAPLDRTAV